ncbi:MAG: TonB-dependent receptor [Bacteroidetes bacterium]|nr:TonB-dependent receptor [Bacteroidota bacterium]
MKKTKQLILATLFLFAPFIKIEAQITSSGLTGKVADAKGEFLPGVVVLVTHNPTGTKYPTMTDLNGVYHLVNLIPGGPYTIKATYIGQKDQVKEGVNLVLGENLKVNIIMQENTQDLAEVEVVTNTDDNKKGTGSKITKEQIQQLPTLSRSITDFTKLTPQSSNNSFAGTNFRYNNITVDGAVNNDAIGFSPSLGGVSGTSNMPGSSTRTNPISLDAIETMAVSIAPYDVKLGNFTGGSINAVTRRGTNDVSASVYSFGRGAAITGKDNAGDKSAMPSSYYDYQTGIRVGLPIIKDKLFFFTNIEKTDRVEPQFYEAGQNGTFMTTAIAQQITDSLKSSTFMPKSQYNPSGTYDPGAYDKYSIYSRSTKFFSRVDWNINNKNQLSIRNNYVTSSSTNLEQNATQFQFGNYDFTQNNVNNSTVLELKSQINNKMANSFILGYTNIHDYRTPQGSQMFPQIQINNVNGGGVVLLGTNREAAIFNMKQKTFEITNNLTWFKGKHTITAGTHNEIYSIDYGFINSWNGRMDYNNLNDFFANKPSRIRAIYNLGDNSQSYNNNNPVAKFNVYLLSAYLQDEFAATENFKITAGLRVDYTGLNKTPNTTPSINSTDAGNNYGNSFTYTKFKDVNNKFLTQPVISPRLGFTWDVMKNKKLIVRGGSGVFSGRIPFAWFGYAYYNNGVNFGAFDYKPGTPSVKNIPTDPTQFAAYNTNVLSQPNRVEVDLIDNNFKMPRVWRSNLATDIIIPGGVKLTLEGIFTKSIYDVQFKQINLKDSTTYRPIDVNQQQPVYLSGGSTGNRVNSSYSAVYMMTNTNKGYRYQLTAQLSKEFKMGLNIMAAYTYGQSYDIANGIRNSYESNWQVNQALNPNNPGLAFSNFDIRHRIISTLGYKKSWNKMLTSYISFVFSAQSGSPYTWVLNSNNVTKSGTQVDLAYVPASQSEVNLVQFTDAGGVVHTPQQQWNELDAYISSDKYLNSRRGKFTERNAGRTPWNNLLDIRFMQDVNFYTKNNKKHTLQITFDITNLTNLIDPAAGRVYFVPNTINQSASFGLTPLSSLGANGNPNYNYTTPTTQPYTVDKLNSRWQGQLGVRYSF